MLPLPKRHTTYEQHKDMSRMLAAGNLHNRRQAHHKENIVQHVLAQLDADVAWRNPA